MLNFVTNVNPSANAILFAQHSPVQNERGNFV